MTTAGIPSLNLSTELRLRRGGTGGTRFEGTSTVAPGARYRQLLPLT